MKIYNIIKIWKDSFPIRKTYMDMYEKYYLFDNDEESLKKTFAEHKKSNSDFKKMMAKFVFFLIIPIAQGF